MSDRRRRLRSLLRESDAIEPAAPIWSREDGVQWFVTSYAQERLWLLDQLKPGNPAYNLVIAHRLRGSLRPDVLERAINMLVARHSALRTTFDFIDSQILQKVVPELELPLALVDLRPLSSTHREPEALKRARSASEEPFNLSTGPLLRPTLIQLDDQDHVLVAVMHHIVSDGWSISLLNRELSALYGRLVAGIVMPLPELGLRYVDFAAWQRDESQKKVMDEQLVYWKSRLQGAPSVQQLPTDFARPAEQTFEADEVSLLLTAAEMGRLEDIARSADATLYMALLAICQVLIHRYTGEEDLLVGSPVAGRTRPECEELVGFFLNHLVMRVDVSGDPSFLELLARVRQTSLEAYEHQDVPFEQLVQSLQPRRDLSRTPLFQVFVNVLNLPDSSLQLAGVVVDPYQVPAGRAPFDITIYGIAGRQGLELRLVYYSAVFGPARMKELLGQLEYLIQQACDDPCRRVSKFSLVPPSTRALLPNPQESLDSGWRGSVVELVQSRAASFPESPAIVANHSKVSYRQLDLVSDRVSQQLVRSGIKKEQVVAIMGRRTPAMVYALLGVLKAGAAFMILDPAFPVQRLVQYVEICRPQAWVVVDGAQEASQAVLRLVDPPRCSIGVADEDALGPWEPVDGVGGRDVATGPDDLAYVAFTSGSTGVPKAVLGRHGPLTHFVPWMVKAFRFQEGDRFSMLSGLSHDPLHRDIFTPLMCGAAVCCPPFEDVRRGDVADWMRKANVTVAHMTPGLAHLVIDSWAERRLSISSLRYAFFVGDRLTVAQVREFRTAAPSVTIVNYYGTTETQRAVSYFVIPSDLRGLGNAVVPLGRGIPDVQLLTINESSALAGVGELGEICVRSPHLARGYLDDDELTRERFVVSPFTRAPGDRLYRTGDRGRFMPDGSVEFVGRDDTQVQIRGYRVEPAEIEAAICRHDAVQHAIVAARGPEGSDQRLVAYLVLRQGATLKQREMREFLRARLPDYMLPGAYVWLPELPISPNGKLDWDRLPDALSNQEEPKEVSDVGPDALEQLLTKIWADVLQRETIGLEDNFFQLGGHSLLASQVAFRIRDAFAIRFPLRAVFDHPTIGETAKMVAMLIHEQIAATDNIDQSGTPTGLETSNGER